MTEAYRRTLASSSQRTGRRCTLAKVLSECNNSDKDKEWTASTADSDLSPVYDEARDRCTTSKMVLNKENSESVRMDERQPGTRPP